MSQYANYISHYNTWFDSLNEEKPQIKTPYWYDVILKYASYVVHYTSNYKLAFQNSTDIAISKIPLMSHSIWIINPLAPREVRDSDLDNVAAKIKLIDGASLEKWTHYFWTNCKTCLPKTLNKLSSVNIIVRDVNDYSQHLPTVNIINAYLNDKDYRGLIVDLLREDIIHKFGGFYSDLNDHLVKSPEHLMKIYDGIWVFSSRGVMENYAFAAIPEHPALDSAMKATILRLNTLVEYSHKTGCKFNKVNDAISFPPFTESVRGTFFGYYETNDFIVTDIFNKGENQSKMQDQDFQWYVCNDEDKERDIAFALEIEEKDGPFMDLSFFFNQHYSFCSAFAFGYDADDGETWSTPDNFASSELQDVNHIVIEAS